MHSNFSGPANTKYRTTSRPTLPQQKVRPNTYWTHHARCQGLIPASASLFWLRWGRSWAFVATTGTITSTAAMMMAMMMTTKTTLTTAANITGCGGGGRRWRRWQRRWTMTKTVDDDNDGGRGQWQQAMGMSDDNEKGANKGAYGAYATVFFAV